MNLWQKTVRQFKEHRVEVGLFLIWFLAMPIFYFLLNRPIGEVLDLTMDIDLAIPLRTEWILLYHLYYPLALYTAWSLLIRDPERLRRFSLNLIFAEIAALITYVFFQTEVPRPEIVPTGLWDRLTLLTYASDNPYNGFPSLHVITLTAIIIHIGRANNMPRRRRVIVSVLAMLIIASTVLVKQHVFLDIIGGVIYSAVAWWLVFIVEKRRESGMSRS